VSDRVAIASIRRFGTDPSRTDQDLVAVEAPLTVELRHAGADQRRSLGVFMRTPGDDRDLVLGLLFTEGLIRSTADVVRVTLLAAGEGPETADVELAAGIDLSAIDGRVVAATSACGLCGRLAIDSLDALAGRVRPDAGFFLRPAVVSALPDALRRRQRVFAETGGLHAAGLCTAEGELLVLREDVGRHNAVDKVVGASLDAGQLPAVGRVLAVSGRVAYEIVQKAAMAGVAAIVAVGAPSSLAIDAARAARMTLVGFARDGRFNVYAGEERVHH
jgi:FdhD protein